MIELILTILFVIYGWKKPHHLILVFIYTFPYLGNAFITWIPPQVLPGQVASYALLVIGILRFIKPSRLHKFLQFKSLFLMNSYFFVVTVFNVLLLNTPYIEFWTQSPYLRAVRGLLGEIFFWCLPLLSLGLIIRFSKSVNLLNSMQKYLRSFTYAGFLYAALGIIQFLFSFFLKIDLFPIVRGGTFLQPVALGGLAGRITSICGEPRHLSAYAILWFVLLLVSGKRLNFNGIVQTFGCIVFATVIFLSGSRTGILGLGLVLVVAVITQLRGGLKLFNLRQGTALFLVLLTGILITSQEGSSIATRTQGSENIYNEKIRIGDISIPVEFQDYQSIDVLLNNPINTLTGMGSGLWQYHFDPFSNAGIASIYRSAKITAIDSVRPNLGIVSRFSDYGIVGLLIIYLFYKKIIKVWSFPLSNLHKREFLGVFFIFLTVTQIVRGGELYAHFLLFYQLNYICLTSKEVEDSCPKGIHPSLLGQS
jgi:hypothetical protein